MKFSIKLTSVILFAACYLSCEKNPSIIGADLDLDKESIIMEEGRLVFSDRAHLQNTMKTLFESTDKTVHLPEAFKSYEQVYQEMIDMPEASLEKYIETDEFDDLFNIDLLANGEKSIEPIAPTRVDRSLLNSHLEVQIDDIVLKLAGDDIYEIPVQLFSRESFKDNSITVTPILNESHSRATTIDDCTEFFGRKHGSWQNKMQGKIESKNFGGGTVFYAVTRSRERTSFGWWRGTRDYPLALVGTMTIQAGGPSSTLPVSESCGGCADVETPDIPGTALISASVTHTITCGNDCSGESSTGDLVCTTSK